MHIRPAYADDHPAIAAIIVPTIREGATYALKRDMSEQEAVRYWTGAGKEVFVTEQDGRIIGTYYITANQAGGGSHVCNCGYMTAADATGQGVATAMCEHSMDYARTSGFRAMQFNFVVASNAGAVRLWQRLGFEEVGRLPKAFCHPSGDYMDALIFYRML